MLHTVVRDLVHAAHSLAKTRSFTVVVVASLGIGMGTFVGLVSFIRAMTAPVPGVNTEGLVELLVTPTGPLKARAGDWAIEQWSYPDFVELRDAHPGMDITGWTIAESHHQRSAGTVPVAVPTMFVSANYFRTIGLSLARGSGFTPAGIDAQSDGTGAQPRVVVGHDFWRNVLGSDPDIVGKTITLDDVQHVVAGIAPAGYGGHLDDDFERRVQLFVPLGRHPRLRNDSTFAFNRDIDWVHIYGRLSPGVSIAQANGAVSAITAGLSERYPSSNEFKASTVEPYYLRGARIRPQNVRARFWLLSLSGMVLLVVCLNICGMMLVRGATRERELSIREALGAGRRRLLQYLLSEAVLLAFMGGALSAFVLFGVPALVAWRLGMPVPSEIDFDAVNMAVSIGLCLVVSMVFGLVPAIRFSRPNIIIALKDDAGGGGRRVGRIHRLAAAVQLGIAIPFLVISGMLLDRVRTADFGFETDGLVAARLDPRGSKESSRPGGPRFFLRSVRENLKQASGVTSVTMAEGMPIDFVRRYIRVSGPDSPEFTNAHVTRVAEGFLDTIGVRVLRGRSITAEDRASNARVAVISEPLALKLFPNGNAIGQKLKLLIDSNREQEFTIVGETADFATSQLTTERRQLLLPLPEEVTSKVLIIARGAAEDEERLQSAFLNAVREFDRDFTPDGFIMGGFITGRRIIEKSIEDLIAESAGVAVTGSVVLVLAALGISGVIGFMVATRTREIAVRIALGASRLRVVRLILSDVVKLIVPGLAAGLLIAAVLVRGFLPIPAGTLEPLAYLVAVAIAVGVALVAGLPSARRASSVQPMVAMRSE
jgi:predicted permease